MKQAFKIYIAVMIGILVGLGLGDWLELLLAK
jgi:Na+/H+-dicarboxylate symporter